MDLPKRGSRFEAKVFGGEFAPVSYGMEFDSTWCK